MLALVGIGVAASRRMEDLKDYFAGGKKLGFWAAAFSSRATGESAWLLLGLTGMGAVYGVKAFWVVLGETLGVGLAWIFMAGRFKRLTDRYDSVTIPDYLESRFRDQSQNLRRVAAGCLAVFVTIYVSAQIDATGVAFEDFLGWNYFTGVLVGFGVVIFYIFSGGFLAVVWSDVFQGTLMFLGLVILPIVGLGAAGGWGAVKANLLAQDPNLLHWAGGTPDLLGWAGIASLAMIGLGFLGSPQIFVRFLALRSTKEIAPGATVAVVWTLLADGGAVMAGIVGRAHFNGVSQLGNSGQKVLPLLVDELFPLLVVGIYVAVVLSAIMSTIDSLLVVAGSAAVRDYYQQILHPEMSDEELMSTSRNVTIALAFVALAIATVVALKVPGRTVFWFVIFGWSGIAATFCPVMILSLYWSGLTARGAMAGMLAGFFSVPFFKLYLAAQKTPLGRFFKELSELPPSFLVAGLVAVLVSLADKSGREQLSGVEEELRQSGHDA